MLFFQIILGLWWLWLPLLVIWLYDRGKKQRPNETPPVAQSTNDEWHAYIASFRDVVKSKAEKHLIEALLARKLASKLYDKSATAKPKLDIERAEIEMLQMTSANTASLQAEVASPISITEPATPSPLSNTLLLLYFGAFLLVASAGLFVAIAKLDGLVRTFVLAVTATIMYLAGNWLYVNRKKLAQAGISFMGIGMMIAPLVGVAWYNLVAGQTAGALTWLVTSVVCLGLYVHALSVAKNSFIAYMLIGSFVSVIESAVLTIALPSYAFAWGLIVAGLLLQVFNFGRNQSTDLLEASDTSAQLLIPLSIIGSILLIPQFGSLQLGVTLLLSAGYYALLAWKRIDQRQEYSVAAQYSLLAAIASLSYAAQTSFVTTGLMLGVVAFIYVLLIALGKLETVNQHSLVQVATIAAAASIALSVTNGSALATCLLLGIILGVTAWLRLRDEEAMIVAGILLFILPFVFGQYSLSPHANLAEQLVLCSVAAVLLYGLSVLSAKYQNFKAYHSSATLLFVVSTLPIIALCWSLGFGQLFVSALILSGLFITLQYLSGDSGWWLCAGTVLLVPVLYSAYVFGFDDRHFSFTLLFGLLCNIIISLRTREAGIRWFVVSCILLGPVALGGGGLGIRWAAAGYAGGYLLALAGCMFARAIARGKLFVSSKVPLSGYYSSASEAYIAGYTFSALIALYLSLIDAHSQLVTTVVLIALTIAILLLAYAIEDNDELTVFIPVIAQGILFSSIRPSLAEPLTTGTIALISTGVALGSYFFIELVSKPDKPTTGYLLQISLITSYIGPALAFTQSDPSSLLAIALGIAGALTTYHNRNALQVTKEVSIGIMIAALHWLLYLNGVHNIHIHTHLLALFLASFAIWRYGLGDKGGSDGYVQALFLITTIPMALQALSGSSGDYYGLILIVQQIAFMMIGALANQRFLLRAGLWVSLVAILYQLRGLGWAFLSVLALILIGTAIYRLQKHPEDSDTKDKSA